MLQLCNLWKHNGAITEMSGVKRGQCVYWKYLNQLAQQSRLIQSLIFRSSEFLGFTNCIYEKSTLWPDSASVFAPLHVALINWFCILFTCRKRRGKKKYKSVQWFFLFPKMGLKAGFFSTANWVNGTQHLIILIWLNFCLKGRKIASYLSISPYDKVS